MAEPRIQYAKTSDGVSIAFTVMGQGVPFVYVDSFSHFLLFWRSPAYQPWLHGLADRYQLVLYDPRGTGLSQRGLTEYTAEMPLMDLEAVVDQLALDRFVVFAMYNQAQGAVAYAVKNAGRVAGLILWGGYVRWDPRERTLLSIAETNWEFFLQSIAQTFNWLEPAEVRAYVDVLRQCATQVDFIKILRAGTTANSDLENLLPDLRTPTLVLHPKELTIVKAEAAVRLASLISDARLVLLDGPNAIPTGDLAEPTLRVVTEFVEEVTGCEPRSELPAGAFRTVLFTDLVGHTEMMQRLGDEKGRDVLREHESITRDVLKQHGGTEVKTMGDGFMASFGSVTKAVECAVALQRAFAGRRGEPLAIRVGLNAGEPIEEDGDLFGATVILASRIAAKAEGGEILVADTVRGLCSGKGFLFTDRGEFVAKDRAHPPPHRLEEGGPAAEAGRGFQRPDGNGIT